MFKITKHLSNTMYVLFLLEGSYCCDNVTSSCCWSTHYESSSTVYFYQTWCKYIY